MKQYSLEIKINKFDNKMAKNYPLFSNCININNSWYDLSIAKEESRDILLDIHNTLYKNIPDYSKRLSIQTMIDKMIAGIGIFKDRNKMESFFKHECSYGYIIFKETDMESLPMDWIPCSERLPSKGDCVTGYSNVFIVTIERQSDPDSRKFRLIDQVLINSDFNGWLTRNTDKVVAWLPQIEPYTIGMEPWKKEDNIEDKKTEMNPALLQAWNNKKVLDENLEKSNWLTPKELPLVRNDASYCNESKTGEIHIYFNSQDIPNEVDCIALSINGMIDAIQRKERVIHTIQLSFCDADIIYNYGYVIIIHQSTIENMTIRKIGSYDEINANVNYVCNVCKKLIKKKLS